MMKLENAKTLEQIQNDRQHIDQMVEQSKSLSDEKIEELAQVYGAMKPVEAAPILMNLQDSAVARIVKKVPETRQQAKLLAAIGSLDTKRAAEVTRILGWKKQGI